MEFTRKREIVSPKKISTMDFLYEKYPTDLNMYLDPPTEQVDIEEFQEMAVERVNLLRTLEVASLKTTKGSLFKEVVIEEMTKQSMKYFMPLIRGHADAETRRRDYLSHFILRLCYCRSEELRKWFLARELELFRLKFFNMEKRDIEIFMKKNHLNFAPITDDEKKSIAFDLYNSTAKNINLDVINIYKVPFTQVLDLVKNRKVLIKAGQAYVPQMDFISILTSLFRTKLSHGLTICASNISQLENDERLSKVLKGLHTSYTGNDYCAKSNSQIPPSALDALSVKSFPLCMRVMHETLRKTHHLRNMARLEYGLFLKGIGVSLEDSLKFWREAFTQKPGFTVEMFEKNYAYNIRHIYGTEGKRFSYVPHSCMKIINSSVTSTDNHGCPFKHFDQNALKQKLLSYNLSLIDVAAVMDYVTKGHYQLACTKYFEITHNVTNAKGINHPNQYFEDSQNIINGKMNESAKKSGAVETPKRSKPSSDDWGDESAFDLNITDIINNAE